MTSFTPSFQLIADYLTNHGYQVDSLDIGENFMGFVSISSLNDKGRLVLNSKSPTYPFATISARRIYKNKALAYAFVSSLGIATPSTLVVDAYNSDLDIFLNTHKKLI